MKWLCKRCFSTVNPCSCFWMPSYGRNMRLTLSKVFSHPHCGFFCALCHPRGGGHFNKICYHPQGKGWGLHTNSTNTQTTWIFIRVTKLGMWVKKGCKIGLRSQFSMMVCASICEKGVYLHLANEKGSLLESKSVIRVHNFTLKISVLRVGSVGACSRMATHECV